MPTQIEKENFMRRALMISQEARGYTAPNPMVGCVIVKDGNIIMEGIHERCGEYHAERNALLNCKENPEGADLYVTLEPCCHTGKTPPCTDIIIEKKIKRVFVGAMDSNPLVAGKGVQILRNAGIEVETGILAEECRKVNEVFFHFMEKKRPFVAMKYAMTLDGKIACESGDSKWVTNENSRNYVQQLRKYYSGIMVGIETVLADDPMLNCRVEKGVDPVRIICDSKLRIPLDCNIVKTAKEIPTIVAYTTAAKQDRNQTKSIGASPTLENQEHRMIPMHTSEKLSYLKELGVVCIECGESQVDLPSLMNYLAEQKIDSILLEGGGTLNSSMLQQHLVQRLYAFIAPKLVGGATAKTPVTGVGIPNMCDAVHVSDISIETFCETNEFENNSQINSTTDLMLTGLIQE